MTRLEKILSHVKKEGRGLEIGPSHSPVASKKAGYQVHVLDHLDREGLIQKYQGDACALSNIEEVDYVWNGESYVELIGKTNCYDWIIASHVIEHVPDILGFLIDCSTLLKETGVLSLAIPDKLFCFDYFRPLTGLANVVDVFLQKRKTHSPGVVLESLLYATALNTEGAWGKNNLCADTFSLTETQENALLQFDLAKKSESYINAHGWCFTPHSFRLLIQDLHALGFLSFQELAFYPQEGCEFFCTLSKTGPGTGLSRLELLRKIELEQARAIPRQKGLKLFGFWELRKLCRV